MAGVKVAEIFVNVGASYDDMIAGLSAAESRMAGTSSTLANIGRQMTAAITLPAIAMGTAMAKSAAEFEYGMARVSGITGAVGQDLLSLGEIARTAGPALGISAIDAAQGMKELAQAGFEASEMATALPAVMQLSIAAEVDLAKATELASNTMQSFQLQTSDLGHINDVLAGSTLSTTSTIKSMATALSYVGPVASEAGLSLEQTTAILGELHDVGIKGSRAGTALRRAIADLLDPTAKSSAAFEAMGVAIKHGADGSVDFLDVLRQMENKGATAGQVIQAFGTIAGPGIVGLLNKGTEALETFYGKLEHETGTAASITSKLLDTLQGSVNQLKASFIEAAISAGENGVGGALRNAIDGVRSLIDAFAGMSPTTQQIIIGLTAVLAATGPLILLFNGLAIAISAVTPAVVTLVGVIGGIAVALGGVGTIAAVVIAGLGVAAVTGQWREWGHVLDEFTYGANELLQVEAEIHAENQFIHAQIQKNNEIYAAAQTIIAGVSDTYRGAADTLVSWSKAIDVNGRSLGVWLGIAEDVQGKIERQTIGTKDDIKAWDDLTAKIAMGQTAILGVGEDFQHEANLMADATIKFLEAGDYEGAAKRVKEFNEVTATSFATGVQIILDALKKKQDAIDEDFKAQQKSSDEYKKFWEDIKSMNPDMNEEFEELANKFESLGGDINLVDDSMVKAIDNFIAKWGGEPKDILAKLIEKMKELDGGVKDVGKSSEKSGSSFDKFLKDAANAALKHDGGKPGVAAPKWDKTAVELEMAARTGKNAADAEALAQKLQDTGASAEEASTAITKMTEASDKAAEDHAKAAAAADAFAGTIGMTGAAAVDMAASFGMSTEDYIKALSTLHVEQLRGTFEDSVDFLRYSFMLTGNAVQELYPHVEGISKLFDQMGESIDDTIGAFYSYNASLRALGQLNESALRFGQALETIATGTNVGAAAMGQSTTDFLSAMDKSREGMSVLANAFASGQAALDAGTHAAADSAMTILAPFGSAATAAESLAGSMSAAAAATAASVAAAAVASRGVGTGTAGTNPDLALSPQAMPFGYIPGLDVNALRLSPQAWAAGATNPGNYNPLTGPVGGDFGSAPGTTTPPAESSGWARQAARPLTINLNVAGRNLLQVMGDLTDADQLANIQTRLG